MNEVISVSTIFAKDEQGNMVVTPSAIQRIRDMEVQRKKLDKEYKRFKAALKDGMETYGMKKVDTEDLLITYVEPTESLVIDNDRLWKEHKEIAFECQKFVQKSGYAKIIVR